MDGTVLVADDDRAIRTVLTQALTRAGCKVHATSSLTTLMRWVGEGLGDAVITDVVMPDGNGLEMLPKIAQDRPDLPVIVISAQNTIMTAIKATEANAFDYLPKPFDLPDLMKRTAKALQSPVTSAASAPQTGPSGARTATREDMPLIGRSEPMQALYKLISRLMNTDLPLLICGESGTGKSLVAHTIHTLSDRRELPLVTITARDLSTLEAIDQIAAKSRGGTVILDEVADFDDYAQSQCLRLTDMLQTGDTRVISTSRLPGIADPENTPLRDDLFFRLAGAVVEIAPLRQRLADVPLLAEYFLGKSEDIPGKKLNFGDGALDAMRKYNWPGNVRQLEHSVKRISLTAQSDVITAPEVETILGAGFPLDLGANSLQPEQLAQSISQHLQRYFDQHVGSLPPSGLYTRILHEMERPLIEIALDATQGNQIKCADLLGINRNTLRKKITELNIEVTRRRKLM